MTEEVKANIKYRLSDIGAQVGVLALEYISELEKEIAELKAQIKLLTEKVGFWEEQTKLKEAQIEEYDRLNMFDIARTDELKQQIEKMKCCGNCSNSSDSKITVCDKWELAE